MPIRLYKLLASVLQDSAAAPSRPAMQVVLVHIHTHNDEHVSTSVCTQHGARYMHMGDDMAEGRHSWGIHMATWQCGHMSEQADLMPQLTLIFTPTQDTHTRLHTHTHKTHTLHYNTTPAAMKRHYHTHHASLAHQ